MHGVSHLKMEPPCKQRGRDGSLRTVSATTVLTRNRRSFMPPAPHIVSACSWRETRLARRWLAASRPPYTQRGVIPMGGKANALIDRQTAGPAVSRAKLYAIQCSVFWLDDLAVLAPALSLKMQSVNW